MVCVRGMLLTSGTIANASLPGPGVRIGFFPYLVYCCASLLLVVL